MRLGTQGWRLFAALVCLVLVLAGCAEPDPEPQSPERAGLRLALYPSASTLPARAALASGVFERNGLDVEVTEGHDLPLFLAALGRGEYDIAMSGPTLALIGAEKGLDIQIVASMQESTRQRPNAVWFTRDPAIVDIAHLRAKTVAVPSLTGIIADSLEYLLQRSGVGKDEVRLVQMQFATMADQLAAGKVDAAVATLPFSAVIAGRGFHAHDDLIVAAVQAASAGAVDTAMTSVWAANGAFARAHPAAIRAFRRSLAEGIDALAADPGHARTLMTDWLKMPARIVETSALPTWGVDVTPQQMAPYVQIAEAVGALTQAPDVDTLVWQDP